MTSSISASVLIPVLNGADTIGDLLTALTHQIDPPVEREIIVVDNGSSDGTCDIVRQFDAALLAERKPVPSAARNRGLQAAKGEVIAYLDADTIPTRQWLREISKPFDDPQVQLVGGVTFSYAPQTAAQRYIARVGAPQFEYDYGRRLFPFVAARNMAVRRAAALAIDGWAEDMPTAEDVDFCFRLTRCFNTPYRIQPQALIFHRDRASIDDLRRQAWTYGEGWAHVYLKYPNVARWNFGKTLRLANVLTIRSFAPVILNVKLKAGRATVDQVEFATCHRLWSWSFWRGFMNMYRTHRRRVWQSSIE